MDNQLLALANGALCSIACAASQEDIRRALQEFTVGCGFESYGLARNVNRPDWEGEPDLSTWPQALIEGYIRLQMTRFDTTLAAIRHGESQCHWTRLSVFSDMRANPVTRVMHDFGLKGGVVVSLRAGVPSCGALSLISRGEDVASPELIEAARLVGDVALARLACLRAANFSASRLEQLSQRQLEILAWVARGKSNRDIAAIVGLTERSVTYHLSEIFRRLGVTSRVQAAAWFTGSGRNYTAI